MQIIDNINDLFGEDLKSTLNQKQNFTGAGKPLNNHIYDYVVTDSKTEHSFVEQLDTSKKVTVYAKLPRGFFIPTPLGNYNPDWTIAFQEGSVKHVYFVAETKGSLQSLQLKGAEIAKIECAKRFFKTINEKFASQHVQCDVCVDFTDLKRLVM